MKIPSNDASPSERRINAAVDTALAGHHSWRRHMEALDAAEAATALDRLAWHRAYTHAKKSEVPEWQQHWLPLPIDLTSPTSENGTQKPSEKPQPASSPN